MKPDDLPSLLKQYRKDEAKLKALGKKVVAAVLAAYPPGSRWKTSRGSVTAEVLGPCPSGPGWLRVQKSNSSFHTYVPVAELTVRLDQEKS